MHTWPNSFFNLARVLLKACENIILCKGFMTSWFNAQYFWWDLDQNLIEISDHICNENESFSEVNHTWKFGTFTYFLFGVIYLSLWCVRGEWSPIILYCLIPWCRSLLGYKWSSFFLRISVSVDDEKGCSGLIWSCLPFASSFSVFTGLCVPIGAGVNLTQIWPILTFNLQTEEFLFSLFHLLTSLQELFTTQWPALLLGCPRLDLQFLPFLLSLPFPFSFLLPFLLLTYLLSCSFILFFFCCLETALHCCPGWSGNTVLTWPFHLLSLEWEFVSVPCNRNWLNWLGWTLIPGSSNLLAAACFASFVLFCKTCSVLPKRLRGLRHLLLSLTILVGSLGTTGGRRKSSLTSSHWSPHMLYGMHRYR